MLMVLGASTMSEPLLMAELPTLAKDERGGPRYVRVQGYRAMLCQTCGATIPRGTASVIDRVGHVGKAPRRWCARCWDAAPHEQVIR
jgi:hypothetical protein